MCVGIIWILLRTLSKIFCGRANSFKSTLTVHSLALNLIDCLSLGFLLPEDAAGVEEHGVVVVHDLGGVRVRTGEA